MKLIHCADLHFDTPFSGLPDGGKAEIRREDLRRTFARIVALAREEQADALVIAGDLFDSNTVSARTLSLLVRTLGSVPELPVLICGGNHDPVTDASYYRILDWPENVHIFGAEIERVELPCGVIYGASMTAERSRQSVLAGFQAEERDGGKPRVMVLHGDVVAGSGASDYNPIHPAEIASSGLDYLALGHVHAWSGPMRAGATVYAYSGCPEGRGFDELEEKGVVVAEVERGHTELRFLPLCRRQYLEAQVDVTGLAGYDEVLSAIRQAMTGTAEDLYKVVLSGETTLPLSAAVVLDGLDAFAVKLVDGTHPPEDDGDSDEYTIRGLFRAAIRRQPDSPAAHLAAQYGLAALDGEKVDVL